MVREARQDCEQQKRDEPNPHSPRNVHLLLQSQMASPSFNAAGLPPCAHGYNVPSIKKSLSAAWFTFILLTLPAGRADEGMWLFNQFPAGRVEKKYGVAVTGQFLD